MKLRVESKSGSINVVAEEGATLSVTGADVEMKEDGSSVVRSGSHSINVRCAPGTDIVVGTLSGSVRASGPLGKTHVASKSGSIEIDDAAAVDARTHSGSVRVGECAGDCRVVVTSGKIRLGRVGNAALNNVSGSITVDVAHAGEVKTVSGTVRVGTSATGLLKIRSISGTVEIAVPVGRTPATRLKSISGSIHNDCDQGTDGEIDVKTVSGTIRIECR